MVDVRLEFMNIKVERGILEEYVEKIFGKGKIFLRCGV